MNSKDIMSSLAPMLSVRRGKEAVEFYKKAFGAQEMHRIEDDKGEVVVRLSINGSDFWVADESPEYKNFSPESLGGGTVRMVLVDENPDAIFEKAVSAGATAIAPMADHDFGWRVGRVLDPFGHSWEIGKPLAKGE